MAKQGNGALQLKNRPWRLNGGLERFFGPPGLKLSGLNFLQLPLPPNDIVIIKLLELLMGRTFLFCTFLSNLA